MQRGKKGMSLERQVRIAAGTRVAIAGNTRIAMNVLDEEHEEDMLRLAGVGDGASPSDGVFTTVRQRLPWLVVNLFTASLSAFVISQFESTIAAIVSNIGTSSVTPWPLRCWLTTAARMAPAAISPTTWSQINNGTYFGAPSRAIVSPGRPTAPWTTLS